MSVTTKIMLRVMFNSFLLIFPSIVLSYTLKQWSNHDISTLKLLQIVHRHGDRTPLHFSPNDPFKDISYWKVGIGQLTKKGKYRMYKLGQFIHQEYKSYLGEKFSPHEVYTRSSAFDRCIESVSCLLSGAYPQMPIQYQWYNGSDEENGQLCRTFPIQTSLPQIGDLVVNQGTYCAITDSKNANIYKQFLEKYSDLYKNLSEVMGYKIDSIGHGVSIHDTLQIEINEGYYWNHVWTKDEEESIVQRLLEVSQMAFRTEFDRPVIKRLRGGGLVKELIKNFKSVINNQNNKKFYVYSTHDNMVTVLMRALNIFNDNLIPFGATLLFELHQNSTDFNDYFVKVYYHNQTLIGIPHALSFGDCYNNNQCLFTDFIQSTKHLIYDDFEKECIDFDENY